MSRVRPDQLVDDERRGKLLSQAIQAPICALRVPADHHGQDSPHCHGEQRKIAVTVCVQGLIGRRSHRAEATPIETDSSP